jgi:DNA helicase-4
MSELQLELFALEKCYSQRKTRRILKFLIIGFFIGRNLDEMICELETKIANRLEKYVSDSFRIVEEVAKSGTYLVFSQKQRHLSVLKTIAHTVTLCEERRLIDRKMVVETKNKVQSCKEFIMNYNAKFVKERKLAYGRLWNTEKFSLDDEQQTAIVTDDQYNLVVAAAGSGKTEVLTTRIAYLTKREPDRIQLNRILALAYTNKAKEEIESRLQSRHTISTVNVRTFHKLGKDILEKGRGRIEGTRIVKDRDKYNWIDSYFECEIAANSAFYKLFLDYVKTVHDKDPKSNPMDEKASLEYAKEQSYFSIDSTPVKSKAEKTIMDFLLSYRINTKPISVDYEHEFLGFKPDFYLPQYDLYIEHWGINEKGEVAPFFDQSTKDYKDNMEKKKRLLAAHNKTLVETYSYEYDKNDPEKLVTLLKNRIQQTLQARNGGTFEFTPRTYEEILEVVWGSQKTPIEDIVNFITTAKTYNLTPNAIGQRLESNNWTDKQIGFGKLALQVYRTYQANLQQSGRIDFEDMINNAIEALDHDKNLYANVYDHILIDEYQDISTQRFNLIKRLLERNPNCKLFCVGDDWQSIMSFSGANLNFFINFSDYFQNPAESRICTNYRNSKCVVEAGADLIKNNGCRQIQKIIRSKSIEDKRINIQKSPHKEGYDKFYYCQTVDDCLKHIIEYLKRGYLPEDILIMTRFMRTKVGGHTKYVPIVRKFIQMARDLAELNGTRIAVDNKKEPHGIKLLTVHKCKGLEAKVVFLLNAVKGTYGFPSEIEDPTILEVAREDNGVQDPKEEERRLFYVAITSAEEDLFIYTRENKKSEFLEEINKRYTNETRLNY